MREIDKVATNWNTGRPSKLTEEVGIEICEKIAAGVYVKDAAASLGISPSAIVRWIKEGFRHDTVCGDIEDCTKESCGNDAAFRRFFLNTKRAEAINKERLTNTIELAANKGPQYWTAAAWILERRYPNQYARVSPTAESADNPIPVQINITIDRKAKLLSALSKQIDMERKGDTIDAKVLSAATVPEIEDDSEPE